jgi:hypothetical protein
MGGPSGRFSARQNYSGRLLSFSGEMKIATKTLRHKIPQNSFSAKKWQKKNDKTPKMCHTN